MRNRSSATIALATLILSIGCGEDVIGTGREDAGVGPMDAATGAPLELKPGDTFNYRAILTYRETAGAERNASYTMTVRIETVNDLGPGASTLTFKATDFTVDNDDWDMVRDFDSWVSRLGPALDTDDVSDLAATEMLADIPDMPPAPSAQNPKIVPSAGTFFLDPRNMETIRTAWATAHQAQMPMAGDPAQNGGNYLLGFSGPDESIVYYPADSRLRIIELHYDKKGFLRRLSETIGKASDPPAATCRIELISGP
jgi:hypothetical protein